MTIRIIPLNFTEHSECAPAGSIPPLLFPRLKNVYRRRAARLRQLAEKNPLGDYMRFAAVIATAQEIVLYDHPLNSNPHARQIAISSVGHPPLNIHTLPRDAHWRRLLYSLIAELKPEMTGQALAVLENLEKAAVQELENMATMLFNQHFARINSDMAPVVWAALSLYWAQMAALIPGQVDVVYGEQYQCCPVCGSQPVAGMVHMDRQNGGLRYLHCNLCESEWYVAQSTCPCCNQSGNRHDWSSGGKNVAVKAASCGDCGSYIKMLYQENDPATDAVADDLASLMLDARMAQEGFSSASLNPFLFPEA